MAKVIVIHEKMNFQIWQAKYNYISKPTGANLYHIIHKGRQHNLFWAVGEEQNLKFCILWGPCFLKNSFFS